MDAFDAREKLHIVVWDRPSVRRPGQRERCLAFARPDAE